jgi:hypothetical protein
MTLTDILTGTGGFSELYDKFKNLNIDVSKTINDLFSGIKEIPERKEFKQEIMSDNQFIKLGNVINDSFQNSMGGLLNVLGIQSKGGIASTTINENTNVTVQPINVNVTGDVTLKGPNGDKTTLDTSRELTKFIEDRVKIELDRIINQNKQMLAVPAANR